MKKTLNNIFDEANPQEIEVLINKNAPADLPASTLSSIKKKVYERTGLAKPKRAKSKLLTLPWRAYVAAAVGLCIIVCGIVASPQIIKLLNGDRPPQLFPDVTDPVGTGAVTGDTERDTVAQTQRPPTLTNINNGVLKDASPEIMDVPENMKNLGTDSATEEKNSDRINATVVQYTLDGDVVNWATENDLIYVITKGNNRLVIIDSKSLSPIYNTPLAGVPAEMNIVGDRIYVSFPDLCRIDSFSKADCKKEASLYFDHEVSSFCFDGDYIYYSEHDQHCKVFKKNLVTGALTMVRSQGNNLFYFPKLYLNKEDRILYIGECKSTGSAIYYYDADTLQLKSFFDKNNYGIMNHTREIFHVGDEIFWGNFRLSDTNAKEVIGRYGAAEYGSVVFASEEIVSTYEGLFLTDTYECVVNYQKADFDFEYVIVSSSYNVFFRKRTFDENVIVGLNFEIQESSDPI